MTSVRYKRRLWNGNWKEEETLCRDKEDVQIAVSLYNLHGYKDISVKELTNDNRKWFDVYCFYGHNKEHRHVYALDKRDAEQQIRTAMGMYDGIINITEM